MTSKTWTAELGAELKRRRVAAGYGRMRFADLLGSQRSQVWKWETGAVCPSERYRNAAAELLECEPGDLYPVAN